MVRLLAVLRCPRVHSMQCQSCVFTGLSTNARATRGGSVQFSVMLCERPGAGGGDPYSGGGGGGGGGGYTSARKPSTHRRAHFPTLPIKAGVLHEKIDPRGKDPTVFDRLVSARL